MQLSEFTLLNTRPERQALQLTRLLEAEGVKVLACPVMDIKWLNQNSRQSNPTQFDTVIFTSANAVEGFCKQSSISQYSPDMQFLAIGRATAEAGKQHGLNIRSLSQVQFDSESLLAHPSMQDLSGHKILIVKGVGGRNLLATELQNRQAKVETWDLYQREKAKFCADSWCEFSKSRHPVLLISSLESFHNLMDNLKDFSPQYSNLDSPEWDFLEVALVFSERIAKAMLEQGWERPIEVIQTQSNQGILVAIQNYALKQSV